MRLPRVIVLATVVGASVAHAESLAPQPQAPVKTFSMPRARLYLGGASAGQGGESGTGAVIGYQGFSELGPNTASYLGLEVLGARIGTNGILPVITGDLGLRWAPFPNGFLRPSLRGSVGLSLLLVLPIPSVSLGVGVGVPLFGAALLDVSLGYRHAFNLFDSTRPVQLASLELGLGF
jgi:hypothetical protein